MGSRDLRRRPRRTKQRAAEQRRDTQHQNVDCRSGDDLIGIEADARNGVNRGDENAGGNSTKQPYPGTACVMRDCRAGEGSREHQAFKRNVNNAGPFRKQTAKRSQQ